MRIVIIGASGNAGTALLHALQDEPAVTDIVGVARRIPPHGVGQEPGREDGDEAASAGRPPARAYEGVQWESLDIGLPVVDVHAENLLVERLSEVIEGADAVVQLAWQIQPNRHRSVLRRTNVAGTWRLIRACLRAGVPRLISASSVGAYSPAHGNDPRDETWPAGGIGSSHYSVDKAAQERALDYAEDRGLAVARLRPALIFDSDAASEVLRLFIGPALPPRMLRPGVLPVLPVPAGLRVQAVHGADVADAYRRVLLTGATGAFNIAADEVLSAKDLAEEVDHGRVLEIDPRLVRRAVALGWKTRAVAADPGWVDMAMNVPVMDSSRARRELGWRPQYGARETLRELLDGIADGTGYAGPKLRPRGTWPHGQLPDGSTIGRRLRRWPGKRVAPEVDPRKLGVYLADHVAGATAGLGQMRVLAKQCLNDDRLSDTGMTLNHLADQLEEERELILELMASWELPQRRWRAALSGVSHRIAWMGERVSTRVSLTGSSPALGVLDLELLRGAVAAKVGGWQSLGDLADDLGAPREIFTHMIHRAEQQSRTLEELHRQFRAEEFSL